MKIRELAWDRLLWGVVLTHPKDDKRKKYPDPPLLLGMAWLDREMWVRTYLGEPSRVLLFTTRRNARDFCRTKNAKHKHLGWRFTPVRVRDYCKVLRGPIPGWELELKDKKP